MSYRNAISNAVILPQYSGFKITGILNVCENVVVVFTMPYLHVLGKSFNWSLGSKTFWLATKQYCKTTIRDGFLTVSFLGQEIRNSSCVNKISFTYCVQGSTISSLGISVSNSRTASSGHGTDRFSHALPCTDTGLSIVSYTQNASRHDT